MYSTYIIADQLEDEVLGLLHAVVWVGVAVVPGHIHLLVLHKAAGRPLSELIQNRNHNLESHKFKIAVSIQVMKVEKLCNCCEFFCFVFSLFFFGRGKVARAFEKARAPHTSFHVVSRSTVASSHFSSPGSRMNRPCSHDSPSDLMCPSQPAKNREQQLSLLHCTRKYLFYESESDVG